MVAQWLIVVPFFCNDIVFDYLEREEVLDKFKGKSNLTKS